MNASDNKYHHFAPVVDQILTITGTAKDHHSKGMISAHLVDAFEQGKKFQSQQLRDLIGAVSQDDI